MKRHLLKLVVLVALATSADFAHAAEPKSFVKSFEVKLGAFIKFRNGASLADTTFDLVVDPTLPAWTKQGSKIVVPSCDQSLVGPLEVQAGMAPDHTTSVIHWAVSSLGGGQWPITGQGNSNCFDDSPAPPGGGCHKYVNKQATINVPFGPGQRVYQITAWTSKQGEKSQVKSALLRLNCEAPKPPPTTIKPGVAVPGPTAASAGTTTAIKAVSLPLPQLDLRGLRLDFGFVDANAVEWGKGQPTQKEVLFHEAVGTPYEKGGSQWGAPQPIVVGGQTYSSHAIDSCTSVIKLKKYWVRTRNGGTGAYPGTSSNDLRAATTGQGGSFTSVGAVGSVGANLESNSVVNVLNQGVTFYPSGTYTVKAELLPPAASATPANNAAALSVVFRCKALNSTTWQ